MKFKKKIKIAIDSPAAAGAGTVAKKISSAGIQLLWQTGDLEYVKYRHMESENIRIVPFVNNMSAIYSFLVVISVLYFLIKQVLSLITFQYLYDTILTH